jgi:hypothetical protein
MRKVIIPFVIILLVISSCETTDDILNSIDHEVPTIDFGQDSLTVDAGASVFITATIEDESGIERIEFSYLRNNMTDTFFLTGVTQSRQNPLPLE